MYPFSLLIWHLHGAVIDVVALVGGVLRSVLHPVLRYMASALVNNDLGLGSNVGCSCWLGRWCSGVIAPGQPFAHIAELSAQYLGNLLDVVSQRHLGLVWALFTCYRLLGVVLNRGTGTRLPWA